MDRLSQPSDYSDYLLMLSTAQAMTLYVGIEIMAYNTNAHTVRVVLRE